MPLFLVITYFLVSSPHESVKKLKPLEEQ